MHWTSVVSGQMQGVPWKQRARPLAPPASRFAFQPSRAPNGHPGALGAGKSTPRVLWGCQIEPLRPWGRSVAKSPPRRCLGPVCCVDK